MNSNNKTFIPLGERDLHLFQLEEEIKYKKNLLIKKKNEITKKNEMNEFLSNVKQDYKIYYDYIIAEKQKQLTALTLLKEYLNDLVKTEKVVDVQMKKAKYDHNEIETELNKIKTELDEILRQGSV